MDFIVYHVSGQDRTRLDLPSKLAIAISVGIFITTIHTQVRNMGSSAFVYSP